MSSKQNSLAFLKNSRVLWFFSVLIFLWIAALILFSEFKDRSFLSCTADTVITQKWEYLYRSDWVNDRRVSFSDLHKEGWVTLLFTHKPLCWQEGVGMVSIPGDLSVKQGYVHIYPCSIGQECQPLSSYRMAPLEYLFWKTWFSLRKQVNDAWDGTILLSDMQRMSISLSEPQSEPNHDGIYFFDSKFISYGIYALSQIKKLWNLIITNPWASLYVILATFIVWMSAAIPVKRVDEFIESNYTVLCIAGGLVLALMVYWYIPASGYYYLYDEYYSWATIRQGWWEMVVSTAGDVHPPLYYFFLKSISVLVGDEILHLKLVHLFLIAPLFIGLHKLYTTVFPEHGKKYVVMTMAFLGVNMFFAFASVIRMYFLGAVIFLWSTYFFVQILQKWGFRVAPRKIVVSYGICAILGLYTHNYFLFFTFVQFLFALFSLRSSTAVREELSSILKSYILIWSVFFPWFIVLLEQSNNVSESYWIQPLHIGNIANMLTNYLWYIYNEFQGTHMLFEKGSPFSWIVIWLYLLSMCKFFFDSSQRERFWAWFVQFSIIAPIMLTAIISAFWVPIFAERYFLFLLPLFFLPIFSIGRRVLLIVWFASVPLFAHNYSTVAYLDPSRFLTGFDDKFSHILENTHPDMVIHSSVDSLLRFQYYLKEHPSVSVANAIYIDTETNRKKSSYNGASLFHNFIRLREGDIDWIEAHRIVLVWANAVVDSVPASVFSRSWRHIGKEVYSGLIFDVYEKLDRP